MSENVGVMGGTELLYRTDGWTPKQVSCVIKAAKEQGCQIDKVAETGLKITAGTKGMSNVEFLGKIANLLNTSGLEQIE